MAERRKYKRYPMPRGTFVILRKQSDQLRNHAHMSIGEIAMVLYKSKRELMQQVTDMSFGGVAFDGHHTGVSDADNVELDLLMTEQGIYLHNIPYAAVPVVSAVRGKNKGPTRRTNALSFKNLNAEQKGRVRELLTHHAG